jgi:hypothetical protein
MGQYLLWTQVVLLWALSNYATTDSAVGVDALRKALEGSLSIRRWRKRSLKRAIICGLAIALLPGPTLDHLLARSVLSITSALLVFVGAQGRLWMSDSESYRRWLAEWEIAINVGRRRRPPSSGRVVVEPLTL